MNISENTHKFSFPLKERRENQALAADVCMVLSYWWNMDESRTSRLLIFLFFYILMSISIVYRYVIYIYEEYKDRYIYFFLSDTDNVDNPASHGL